MTKVCQKLFWFTKSCVVLILLVIIIFSYPTPSSSSLACRTGVVFCVFWVNKDENKASEGKSSSPRAWLALCTHLVFPFVRLKYAKKSRLFCRLLLPLISLMPWWYYSLFDLFCLIQLPVACKSCPCGHVFISRKQHHQAQVKKEGNHINLI